MKTFRIDLWKKEEYGYRAAYGFMPNLRAYLHEEDDTARTCMIVAPGGGYCMLAPHEGEPVALRFYEMGLDVFVLTYTNDITMSVPLKRQPMEDIARAVRLVRKNAKEYRIDADRVLICGFSAGGHVCASLCTHFDDITDPDEALNRIPARPDAAILGYPVITTGKYTHIYSIQSLLGKDPAEEELDYFSCEKQVKEDTPPCFLWQTQEDELVPVENSYLFAMALREKKIPFAHYVYPRGRHGLGLADEEALSGKSGGSYVQEQLQLALEHVKADTAVDLSKERREELMQQFFGSQKEPSEFSSEAEQEKTSDLETKEDREGEDTPMKDDRDRADVREPLKAPYEDIRSWPEAARIWFEGLWQ